METPVILTPDQKSAVDQLIADSSGIKDWSKSKENAETFLKRFEEMKIDGDPLVEDHVCSCFRYLPLSIYMLLGMNDTAVSDAYYSTYSDRINKEFVYATGDTYNYLQTFYEALTSFNSYPVTDNMIGAIFHLKDLSFFKSVVKEFKGGKAKAVQWLQFLDNQIDHYMKDGEQKDLFHKEIKAELSKVKDLLLEHKKAEVLSTMDSLFSKLSEIGDPVFREEVKQKFLKE
ncbi:MAG: hypothetical protein PHT07_10285 [Paludibacter sp.]|nr:hypothetical protein [Paludibacter sp.]